MDVEEPDESDIEHVWSMFSNLGIRRTRAPERSDDQLIKLNHFQKIKKYFKNKTFYVVAYHDKYDGPAAFQYTYSLRETTTMGVWMDITASTRSASSSNAKKTKKRKRARRLVKR